MFEGEKYMFLLYITFWDAGAWFKQKGAQLPKNNEWMKQRSEWRFG